MKHWTWTALPVERGPAAPERTDHEFGLTLAPWGHLEPLPVRETPYDEAADGPDPFGPDPFGPDQRRSA